jgi:hypothetical protein
MAKYKEVRALIRGHENRTIRNTKSDSPVSLGQASTFVARSSSSKRSQTLPHQISEGRDRRQQDYHSTHYFLIGLPMPRPWGPPPMMYPPCPPWAGWYRPWTPPPMHFHPAWSGPTEGFAHGGYYTGDDCYGYVGYHRTGGPEDRKIRQSRMLN